MILACSRLFSFPGAAALPSLLSPMMSPIGSGEWEHFGGASAGAGAGAGAGVAGSSSGP